RILENINDMHKPEAIRILQFLTFTNGPLRLEDVVEVLAVNLEGTPKFDPQNRMPDPTEILKCCRSLIILAPAGHGMSMQVQLAHLSVKEFLMSANVGDTFSEHFTVFRANETIATVCLGYLSSIEGSGETVIIERFPLAQYASRIWTYSAKR